MYSPEAARIAVKLGYTNVMVYREGLIGWAKAGYPVEQTVEYPNIPIPLISAKALSTINISECQLIDIRPKESYVKGHIPGAINIDLEILHEQLAQLNKKKRIIIIDHKGKLPLTTGRFLAGSGYQNLARLDGGFIAWAKTGLPIEK